MSALHTASTESPWHIASDAPFALPERCPAGTDPAMLSRYGDNRWVLDGLGRNRHSGGRSVNWDDFPEPLREPFRRAGWVLVNLPTPEALLDRSDARRIEWPSPDTLASQISNCKRFAKWLVTQGIVQLDQVDDDVLADYAVHINGLGHSATTNNSSLYAISRLWGAAPHLPTADRIAMPPWESTSLRDFLPLDAGSNENSTPPIHPAVMSPLLVWALRFTEDLAEDIIAGWAEHQRLNVCVRPQRNPEAVAALKAWLDRHEAEHRPLPGTLSSGQPGVAIRYVAALHDASKGQVWGLLRRRKPTLDLDLHTPMDVEIRGQLHGRPWTPHINYYDAPALMRRLSAAALIVVAYLSGLRPGEVFELEVGCCRTRQDTADGPVRHELHGNFFKGARDDHGKLLPEGARRELPWTTIQPVAHAITVLERIAVGPFLFAADEPWNPSTKTSRRVRTGSVLTAKAASKRIADFITWVNTYVKEAGLGPADHIPEDPCGSVSTKRFRRTVAWHIARLPGGRIALALQYGHLRTTASSGYGNRARHGLRRVLDIESARAIADYLQDVDDRLNAGEGVSGPAAQRLIRSARAAAHRFEGMFLGKAEFRALTTEPEFQVFDNPDAFLTCNKDPSKALCDPDRATRGPRDNRPPSLDRCNPACANVARTDDHIAHARVEVDQLSAEAADPLIPVPLRARLEQRAAMLTSVIERHEATRIQAPAEQP